MNRKQRRAAKKKNRAVQKKTPRLYSHPLIMGAGLPKSVRAETLRASENQWRGRPVPKKVKKMLLEFPTDGMTYEDTSGSNIVEQLQRLAAIESVDELLADPVYKELIRALETIDDPKDKEEQPEYGIFSHSEPGVNPFSESERGEGGISHERESYSFDDRPIINGIGGVPDRRMYQSAAYVSAGRKVRVGLIEKKPQKTVIWLSIWEHRIVLDYVKGKAK